MFKHTHTYIYIWYIYMIYMIYMYIRILNIYIYSIYIYIPYIYVCMYRYHYVFVEIHVYMYSHPYVGNFEFKAYGDLARKKVTFNSGTFSGPPGLENLDKSKPMCPFEKTRKAPISQFQSWTWYWVVSSCFFMMWDWQPIEKGQGRWGSGGLGTYHWRKIWPGAAPQPRVVLQRAPRRRCSPKRWTVELGVFLDGYPGIPGRSWDKMVRNNEPKLEKGLQTPSEFEKKKTMSNSYGLARSAALALGKLLHSIPKRFCRQKGRSRTSSTMRTWMCVCPADRIS